MATFRNIAVSLLYHVGVTEITRTLKAITRDRTRMFSYLRYETGITNDFADPVGRTRRGPVADQDDLDVAGAEDGMP
jgi:hypothetical protein